MSMVSTGRPVFQKGQTPERLPKPMKRTTKPTRVCEAGKMFVSPALRNFAKGKPCQMRSEWCNGNPETTVLCHSRRRAGTGAGQKPHDWWSYHGCSECHAHEHKLEDRELYDAIRRTQYAVFDEFGSLTP